jgi:hypothetical protein
MDEAAVELERGRYACREKRAHPGEAEQHLPLALEEQHREGDDLTRRRVVDQPE